MSNKAIAHYASGMYLVTFTNSDSVFSKKLVIH
ncbi:MAG: hypothetical protein ACI86C_001810 [Candidatus Latescibacterota bacterium]